MVSDASDLVDTARAASVASPSHTGGALERGPWCLVAIGWVASPYRRRFGTPQQAAAVDSDAEAILRMDASRIPAQAFADLLSSRQTELNQRPLVAHN